MLHPLSAPRPWRDHTVLAAAVTAACLAACASPDADRTTPPDDAPASTPAEAYAPTIDPAAFRAAITNPYWPMRPGNRWTFEATTDEGLERTEVVVLGPTRTVMGIPCTVVNDTVTLDGVVVEDTFDWYAQDADGTVWYFGEAVDNYDDGRLTDHDGSWEAGVDGALPGVVMWADPAPGAPYRQEYLAGQAEDMARVVRLDGAAEVPFGAFTGLLGIEEWSPLSPGVVERKWYAPGVGVVLEEGVRGSAERVALVDALVDGAVPEP